MRQNGCVKPSLDLLLARRRRGRVWTARCALIALAWYALGPLPWVLSANVVADVDAPHHHVAADAHDHDDAPHGMVASDIPGSPTHPEDHDCFECQVLNFLARCLLPSPYAAIVAAVDVPHVAPPAPSAAPKKGSDTPRPPIRGPPANTV
jgi:hypothetical protein